MRVERAAVLITLVLCGASLPSYGCNLIAGIDDGFLADAGPDGRVVGRDAAGDGMTKGDGSTHRDATTGDGGVTKDGGGEATTSHEGGPPRMLACTVTLNSQTKVDDLSRADAGATMFNERLWLTPNGSESGFGIIVQISESNDFLTYTVANGTSPPRSALGSLLDVHVQTGGGIEVLTTFSQGPGTNFLQLFTGSQPSNLMAGNSFPSVSNGSQYTSAHIDDLPAGSNDAGYTVGYAVVASTGSGGSELLFGLVGRNGALGPGPTGGAYVSDAGQIGFTNNGAFFANGDALYALMNNIPLDGGTPNAEPDFFADDSLVDAGLLGFLLPPPAMGALMGARTSALDPSKVTVRGATVGDAGVVTCAAALAATDIPGTVLCGPSFTHGATLPISGISFGGSGGAAWNRSTDDFVSFGPPMLGGSLLLLWVSPDGQVIADQTVIPSTGKVLAAAVQFDNFISDNTTSSFDVAWIEQDRTFDGGPPLPDRLFAATVTCE
jgi:hypothetical protein